MWTHYYTMKRRSPITERQSATFQNTWNFHWNHIIRFEWYLRIYTDIRRYKDGSISAVYGIILFSLWESYKKDRVS